MPSGASIRKYRRSGNTARYWIIAGVTKKGKRVHLKTHSCNHAAQLREDLLVGTITGYGQAKTLHVDNRPRS